MSDHIPDNLKWLLSSYLLTKRIQSDIILASHVQHRSFEKIGYSGIHKAKNRLRIKELIKELRN